MGGGEPTEHVLVALENTDTEPYLKPLRSKYPKTKFSSISASRAKPPPASVFSSVTTLVTFATLPQSPSSDAPLLDYVQLFSAGSNHIADTPLYKDTDITIATASGIHGPQIAEWVVMSTLVLNHKYNLLYEAQKRHKWGDSEGGKAAYRDVRDLVGQRLGVLGYGSIGRQVARVGRAMGMNVVAYTASPKDTPDKKKDNGFVVPGTGDIDGALPEEWYSGLDKKSLHNFLKQDIDILLVSVPLTKDTTHMLSTEEFKVLSQNGKKPAFVINIARGPIIDQPALIEALNNGTLRNAALDVTDPEPLPEDSELWGMENVIVTPHVSGVGQAYTERAFQLLDMQLEKKGKGERLINVVQRKRGY